MTTDTDSQAASAPLVADDQIIQSVYDLTYATESAEVLHAVRQMQYELRDLYEADRSRAASRIAELEMDSIYLHEVASPAIGIFQQRDRIQKASIEALQQRVDLLEAQLEQARQAQGVPSSEGTVWEPVPCEEEPYTAIEGMVIEWRYNQQWIWAGTWYVMADDEHRMFRRHPLQGGPPPSALTAD